MSGIYGIISFSEKQCDIDITPMEKWNLVYGRNNRARLEEREIKIGCCLEKLSEEAVLGTPVLHKGEKVAVIDALLYNREELLEKCSMKESCSDEELLLLFVDIFGYEALKDVNGDFAGMVYDTEKGEIVLFRDHMGVRPLFYFHNDKFVSDEVFLEILEELKVYSK